MTFFLQFHCATWIRTTNILFIRFMYRRRILCTSFGHSWPMLPALVFRHKSSQFGTGAQGFWRNEGSMNRGLDRGRGIGIGEAFFVIHVRTSKSTRHFKFRTNSASISPSSFQKASSKPSGESQAPLTASGRERGKGKVGREMMGREHS
jgi:hypothetical protein